MKRLMNHLPLLQYLQSLAPSEQKKIINSSNNELLKLFSELCLNITHKNINLTSSQIKNLRRFENEIKKLSERQHSYKLRKKILSKGSFLKTLLVELMPSLIEIILKRNEMKQNEISGEKEEDAENVYD